jgi:hypothetical protein
MKNVALAGIAFLLLSSRLAAETINSTPRGMKSDYSLLAEQCGYALNKNIINNISKSSSKINDHIISFNFYILLKPASRAIRGKLSFGCFMRESSKPKQDTTHRQTAAEEIAQADSGGRYAHNIVWQRTYEGDGWIGTIAYANSVFGDQKKLNIPDYFLICPNNGELVCFSFEADKNELTRKESDRIPELLHGIMYVNSSKTAPATYDR